jgi:hypothetical protein
VAPLQKTPILVDNLRAMLSALRPGLIGVRDRAVLVLGFAGAFRRSELVALELGDVAFVPAELEVTMRRSKTDPESAGRRIGTPHGSFPATCPVGSVNKDRSAGTESFERYPQGLASAVRPAVRIPGIGRQVFGVSDRLGFRRRIVLVSFCRFLSRNSGPFCFLATRNRWGNPRE